MEKEAGHEPVTRPGGPRGEHWAVLIWGTRLAVTVYNVHCKDPTMVYMADLVRWTEATHKVCLALGRYAEVFKDPFHSSRRWRSRFTKWESQITEMAANHGKQPNYNRNCFYLNMIHAYFEKGKICQLPDTFLLQEYVWGSLIKSCDSYRKPSYGLKLHRWNQQSYYWGHHPAWFIFRL